MSERTRTARARPDRRDYELSRLAKVEEQNAKLEIERADLQRLLKDALAVDSAIDLETLKTTPQIPRFRLKRPRRENYLPEAPVGLGKMLPWRRKEFDERYFKGDKKYKLAEEQYQKAKRQHEQDAHRKREKAFAHNQEIESFIGRLAAGESAAVEEYFARVLNKSEYPATFPQKANLTYVGSVRQLAVDYDLPVFKIVPAVKAYRYIKARDEVTETAEAQAQRRGLYSSVLAQIALRTLHEILGADEAEKVDSILFNGYVKTIDPSTGKPGEFCLLAVSATRAQFLDLNLELVDPLECVRGLGGRLSRKPDELAAVEALEPLEDDVTPVNLSRAALDAVIEEQEPRRADEVYQRVSTAAVDEPSGDIPIPAREAAVSGGAISPTGAHFVEHALEHADRSEASATAVPFQQYWPTYAAMSDAQQRWYFYWRDQARQGKRLPTDLSYLFVHIYEVINLVGFDEPGEALAYLIDFWRYYRELQPKLDRYLPDWIADFIVLHELAPDALAWYQDAAGVTNELNLDFAIEAWLQSGADFEALSIDIIFDLANYHPKKNKFYKQHADTSALDSGYKQGLAAVDAVLRAESGNSLFEAFQSGASQVIRRAPFSSALHAYPIREIEVACVHAWHDNKPLVTQLYNILKYTENILRAQSGYSYKLRNIHLDERWAAVIQNALTPAAAKPELSIDLRKVAQLSQESEALRERLLAEDDGPSEPQVAVEPAADEALLAAAMWRPEVEIPPKKISRKPERVVDWSRIGGRRLARAAHLGRIYRGDAGQRGAAPVDDETRPVPVMQDAEPLSVASDNGARPAESTGDSSGYLERPDGTPADLLTDLPEVARIMGDGEGKASQVIAAMMAADWECGEAALQSVFPGEFISVFIEEINSRALDEIGDTLLFDEGGRWVVLEDYRDEIEYILAHPEYLGSQLEHDPAPVN